MKKMLLLLALFLWTGMQVTFAQTRTVKGKVLDENGEGLPAATVKVKGSNSGTTTDIDGNYEVTLPEGSSQLEITSLGLETKTVTIEAGSSDAGSVSLGKSSSTDLEGVSIYGQKVDKKTYTGSVNTIGAKEISRNPVTDIAKALEGTAPGVGVTSGGGQPGASPDIQIRGQNTLSASGAPLIVLDGAPYSGSLVSINPSDVESMTILKDAAATSIYGSRGANGVILVVTKRGKNEGKPRITIDASVGTLNRFMPLYETLGSKEYLEVAYQAWYNGPGGLQGKTAENFMDYLGNYNPYKSPIGQVMTVRENGNGYGSATVDPNAELAYNDSWFKEVTRTGIRHNYNVAVSNGDSKSDYYFSVGYVNDQGIVKNSSYDRVSTRLTVNSNITSWLKSGMSLAGSMDKQRFFEGDQQAYINPFMTAQVMGPIYPVYRYDSSGNRMTDINGDPLYDFGVNQDNNNPSRLPQTRPFATNMNPIASLYQDDRSTRALNGFGNAYLEAKFLKDFTLRSNYILNYYQSTQNQFQNMLFGDANNIGGRFARTVFNRFNYTFNQLLTWKPTFSGLNPADAAEGHNLDLVIGHENYYTRDEQEDLERTGFTGPEFQEGAAAAIGTGSSSAKSELAIESYFAMLSYNYHSKYFLSASLRTDGSSRFAPDSRWGTFWSVGAGWMIKDESFMKDVSWVNMLKLRGSYGVAGNEALNAAGYYAWMPRYSFQPNNSNPGLIFSTWGNKDLKWEGSYKFNVGFDYGFFQNRITGSIDYFNSGANNLLFVKPFAPSVGSGGIYSNVGNMQNSGIELQVIADVVRAKKATDFNWNIRVNLTHLKNKITKVQGEDSLTGGGTILAKGLAVSSFYLPHYAGVNPETGAAQYEKRDGSLVTDYALLTGEDYNVYGSSFRDIDGSFTSTFSYKNFDLSFLLSFGIGGKFYDGVYAGLMASERGQAYAKDMLNRWQNPGDVTDVPKPEYNAQNQSALSDRFLVSNSFAKLKNINLGYNFSAETVKRISLQSLRIYVAMDNVYYISARKGLDVQQDFFGSSSFTYFPYRTMMFGVQVGL